MHMKAHPVSSAGYVSKLHDALPAGAALDVGAEGVPAAERSLRFKHPIQSRLKLTHGRLCLASGSADRRHMSQNCCQHASKHPDKVVWSHGETCYPRWIPKIAEVVCSGCKADVCWPQL